METGNELDLLKKVFDSRFEYEKSQSSADAAETQLTNFKTGAAKTLHGVFTDIATTKLTSIAEVAIVTGALA